jgi:anti-anti-sigma factor
MSPTPQSAFFEILPENDHILVRFTGCNSLNEFNSEAVGADLFRLAEEYSGQVLHVDLAPIRYATSLALGKLIGLNRRVQAGGGRLLLLNPTRTVAEAISVTRLDTVLEIQDLTAGVIDPAA